MNHRRPQRPNHPLLATLRSPALGSALTFAAGGVGFALGNILLARVLPPQEYGAVALFVALTQLGSNVGPLGVESVINRHQLGATRSLLGRVALTSALVGIAFAMYAANAYAMNTTLSAVLAATIVVASVNRVAGAFFQSRQKFGLSLFLVLVHNWILVCAVPIVLLAHRPDALPAALTTTAGYVLMSCVGWRKSFQQSREAAAHVSEKTLLVEGGAAVGAQLALSALFQIDRLLIPSLLSISELATYSVVAALAASPFRMLQVGLGYSLLPRLRACQTREAIHHLLRQEARVAITVGSAAAVGVYVITPWLLAHPLGGRYPFTTHLLLAFVVVGFVRLWDGIARALVTALGRPRDLHMLNACSWAALAMGALSASFSADAGLTGIVYGVGAGWLTLAIATTALGWRAIDRHVSSLAQTPAPAGSLGSE